MILTWCLYAFLVALLATGAAMAGERALRLYDRPARWVWLGAMLLSVGLPLAYGVALAAGGPPPQPVIPAELPVIEIRGLSIPAGSTGASRGPVDELAAAAPWLWLLSSLWLALWLVRSKRRLRESEAGWRPASTAFAREEPVYRAETFGPAVVGFASPRIVLPDWVADLDDERRRLVMLHEHEHLRCRDPMVVLAGWAFLVAVPWLAPLWWQFRRLRLAVEKDCDRRVVEQTGDARRYGRLLLEAEELSGGLAAPLVTSGGSFVGDRIRSLVEATPRFRDLRAAGAVGALAAALLAAGMVPPPGVAALDAAAERIVSGEYDTPPKITNREHFIAEARAASAAQAEGALDTVIVRTHITPGGNVNGGYVSRRGVPPEMRRAALQVIAETRFRPAMRDGEPVQTWVAVKIPFGP